MMLLWAWWFSFLLPYCLGFHLFQPSRTGFSSIKHSVVVWKSHKFFQESQQMLSSIDYLV
ncbi:hypothetical protein KP509_31G067200 [Ceratopteris richardii]|uniref:Uncharacterized protein n=1 Tax=Ceratopteris richardii TaxID=49495 RepID=A0A8T2R0Q5_CERRI|nr:hypothetical protein KP509_31G067200 [Ceratopteris richardii]